MVAPATLTSPSCQEFAGAGQYRRHQPEKTVLFQILQNHWRSFVASLAAEREETCLPRFVTTEIEAFMRCGVLAYGFVRAACRECNESRLVAFSCKRRGICPSCAGRRMNERAAHLVDCVFPHVPVRQWVLTVPHGLRFKMAYDPALTRAVHRTFIRAVSSHLRRKARRLGIRNTVKTGAVTVIQRFDSALALNVHFHALVLDGVYAMDELGRPQFHPTPGPSDVEVARVAQTVFRKVYDALEDNESGPTEDDAVMAVLASASIERKVTVGPRRGFPLRRLRAGRQPEGRVLGRRCAEVEGFNVHANTCVAANQRRELEALCRYIARPPVSDDRLEWTSDRNVALRLKRPWSDGTTHLLFSPEELIEKLIPLVPRPRCHLTLFSGVLAPAAGWRPLIVPGPRPEGLGGSGARDGPDRSGSTDRLRNWISWADLLRRVFLVDALECPRCKGRMRIVGAVTDPMAVEQILNHVGLSSAQPSFAPARAPPDDLRWEGA